IDHTVDAQRIAYVDADNASLDDRGRDDAAMGEAVGIVLAGVSGGSGDLGSAVNARGGTADIGLHGSTRSLTLLRSGCGGTDDVCIRLSVVAQRSERICALQNAAPIDVAHTTLLSDCDCGVPFAAWVSARTMPRRARSILKVLYS